MVERTGLRTPRADPLGRPPPALLAPAAIAVVFLALPLVALVLDSPWRTLPALLTDGDVLRALWLSALTSTLAMAVSAVVGLPLAWLLARVELRGRGLLRALVTVPLVLPPVVAGVALLSAFGRSGLLGRPLDECCGLTIPYTTPAVVLAHTFVALPFFVLSVEGALRAAGSDLERAAATLGADRWTTFRRVSVPLVAPGIAAGLVLGWARSLGEFGATLTFAGSFPGTTRTMPLQVYAVLTTDADQAKALSVVLLVVSLLVLASLRDRWWRPL